MAKRMDKFKLRLQKETEHLFKVTFPRKCERFQTMLAQPMFSMETMTDMCQNVRMCCQAVKDEVKARAKTKEGKDTKTEVIEHEDDGFYTPVQSDSELENTTGTDKPKTATLKRKLNIIAKKKNDSDDEEFDYTKMDCNPHISKIIDVIKPEIRELIECCNTVKTWVQLQIPEIQDGNNFGVEVQEEVLEEVRKVEDDSNTFLKTVSVYHLTRAEMVTKFVKHPGVADYVCALEQLDVKEFVTLRLMALELRNYCLSLLDMFAKNMDKLMSPRGSSSSNMLIY